MYLCMSVCVCMSATYQVDITEFIEPEVVDGSCDHGKVVLFEPSVGIVNGNRETTKDPSVHDGLFPCELGGGGDSESVLTPHYAMM